MQRIGGQLGTNPGGIFQDESGRRYYVKTLESAAHARNETIAARLYKIAGASTLNYVPAAAPNQISTQWVHLDKKCVAHLSEDQRKQAQRWFGVHAWTANWDVAGFNGDNQGVTNGKVLTLDVSGALSFRAQGDPKGKAFGICVDEINVLRTDDSNPHAVKLFAGMSSKEIEQAIMLVMRIPDERIRQVIIESRGGHKLADQMLARKANMSRRLMEYQLITT
jgi:hypothetical protein